VSYPNDLALLLDYARAEAKRHDHAQVALAHIAAALRRRDPSGFTSSFGPEATAKVDALLAVQAEGTGTPTESTEVTELLARASVSANAADVVGDAIRELLKSDAPRTGAAAAGSPESVAPEMQQIPTVEHAEPARKPPPVPAPIDKAALLRTLQERIVGQDAALEEVVDRLVLTRMQFDLRPNRPDGVFLFAGPSGTGKSALARAMAVGLFGGEDRLINLDMSEYAHDWAVSRLIGPQPGYIGYDKPEGWLTTKVRRQPESVILLDEIEKSHPTVWNTFLQVFNDGRLTDGQGREADFSQCVIVMTSNLGSENFRRKHPIGFTAVDTTVTDAVERTLDAVKQAMPPEFINRLDSIVMFNPLSPATIREIAGREIAGALARLRERGYDTEVPSDVVAFIAAESYDPAYGARHLHRSIERHLLQSLVGHSPGRLRAVITNGEVTWTEAS